MTPENEEELELDELEFELENNDGEEQAAPPVEQEITPFDPPVSADSPELDFDLTDDNAENIPLALEELPSEEITVSLQLRPYQTETDGQRGEREVWLGVRIGKKQPQFAVVTLSELGELPQSVLILLAEAAKVSEAKPSPTIAKQPPPAPVPAPASSIPANQPTSQVTPHGGRSNEQQLTFF
jgi:hypothetical protein